MFYDKEFLTDYEISIDASPGLARANKTINNRQLAISNSL